MTYKLFLPVLLSIVVAIGGCKKDSGPAGEGENYIRFKVDGKQVVLQALTQSQLNYSAGAGLHFCIMLASEQASVSNRNVLTITINGTQAVAQKI